MRIENCLNNRRSNSEPETVVTPKMHLSNIIYNVLYLCALQTQAWHEPSVQTMGWILQTWNTFWSLPHKLTPAITTSMSLQKSSCHPFSNLPAGRGTGALPPAWRIPRNATLRGWKRRGSWKIRSWQGRMLLTSWRVTAWRRTAWRNWVLMRKEDKTFMAVEGKAKTSVEQNNSDTFNLMFLKATFKHPSGKH